MPEGAKWPKGRWKQYQSRIASDAELLQAFRRNAPNLCMICGAVSGNLEVLDFDFAGDYDAFVEVCGTGYLRDIIDSCYLEQSPRGGNHLYYRCDEPVSGNTKLARNAAGIATIETRGEGGLILCYPSAGYTMLHGKPTLLPTLHKKDVDLLRAVAMLFDQYVGIPKPIANRNSPPKQYREGLTPWEDYDERGDYTGVLAKHGWTCVRCNASDHCMWRRPGKSDGVSATTGYGNKRWFYNFSANGLPFDTRGYAPHAVFAILECKGDFRMATKKLKEMGYGG